MSGIKKILENKNNLSQQLKQHPPSNNLSWIEQYNSQIAIDNSMSQWPQFPQLKKQINAPLCLSVTPFQQLDQIGFVQDLNNIRCFSCKAFVSKLCCITNEKSYDCSICGATNTFQKPIDTNLSIWNKIGYQVEVGNAYRLKVSTPPTLTLVIDISNRAGKQGYLQYLVYSIKQYIRQIEKKDFFQVLIITYDKYPHFYNLTGQYVQKIIVTDQFTSKDIDLLSNVQDKLLQILDCLQETSLNNHVSSSCGIIKALQMAVQITRVYSGNILVFSSLSQPIQNPKANDPKQKIVQMNKQLERKFIIEMKNANNSITFFMFPSSYINLSYFYGLTKLTNGNLFHYPTSEYQSFYYDLNTTLFAEKHYQVIAKVRNTPGIKLSSVFGNYLASNVHDQILLYTCSDTKSYLFQFNIEAKINSVYSVIQFAFLFCTKEGKRKFRIMNHIVINQQNGIECLKSIDYSVVSLYYIKAASQTLDSIIDKKIIRTVVQQKFSKHMRFHRDHFIDNIENKDTTLYATITYSLLRSTLLNAIFSRSIEYDFLTYYRSLNLTLGFNEIALITFPIPYGITAQKQQIIELTTFSANNYSIVVIDRFVQLVIFLNLRMHRLRQIFGEKIQIDKVNQESLFKLQGQQIRVLQKLIFSLRKNKTSSYQRLRFVNNIDKYLLFSVPGNFGYQNFIKNIIK